MRARSGAGALGTRGAATLLVAGVAAAGVLAVGAAARKNRRRAAASTGKAAGAEEDVPTTPADWLDYALRRMRQRTPPEQSAFRVYCVIAYVDAATGRRGHICGSNAEATFIGQSICAERSACVQLRELPDTVRVSEVYVVSDNEHASLTCGVLCREFLLSYCGADTRCYFASKSGAHVRSFTLKEMYPYRSLYTGTKGRDAAAFAAQVSQVATKPLAGGSAAFFPEDAEQGRLRRALFSEALALAERDSHLDWLHPMRYAAGILLSDGTKHATWQRRALEYGNTLDAVSALLPEVEASCRAGARPVFAVMVDQFGLLHAPFAPARSLLSERGMRDLLFAVHDYWSPNAAAPHPIVTVPVRDLVPDAPDMQALFAEGA